MVPSLLRKAYATATGSTLIALVCLTAPQTSGADLDRVGLDPGDRLERGRIWLSGRVEAMLSPEEPEEPGESEESDVSWDALALAASALARHADPRDGELVARVRAGLVRSQRADGSLGAANHAVRDTWLGLAVLAGDSTDAERARAFLDETDGPTASRDVGAGVGTGGAGDALDFLASTRTNRRPAASSAELEGLYALAGGRFDMRAALRYLRSTGSLSNVRLTVALGLPGLGAVHELHLAARILGRTGRARLIAEDGRTHAWPAVLLEAIDRHWREADAAWGEDGTGDGGGRADVRSTASALLALDALRPWAALSPAMMDELDAAEPRIAADLGDDCEACHARLSPGLHYQWDKSAHADSNVGCAKCHGENHSRIFREEGRVSAAVCGSCHEEEFAEFATSGHARAMHTLEASALFATTAPAARETCFGCHATGYEHVDGSVGSCNHCHSGHEFSAEQARQPGACTICHTGDDYPQENAYRLSKHGVLYEQTGDERIAPTCATCHHPGGSHADGFGITIGGAGTGGVLAGHEAPIAMKTIAPAEFAQAREAMVGVCAECHSTRFSKDSLARADAIKREGTALLARAREVIEALHAEGLLGSPPSAELLLGGEQVLADAGTPGAELLDRFYVMWRFHYNATWKGAYHSSPSVANLASRPGLQRDLDFIIAEAARLRGQR